MSRLIQLYRTTEGIVIAMSLYVTLAVGVSLAWPVATAGPVVFGFPFAIFALVFGGVGLYMFADAIERVFNALAERYGEFFNEVMNA